MGNPAPRWAARPGVRRGSGRQLLELVVRRHLITGIVMATVIGLGALWPAGIATAAGADTTSAPVTVSTGPFPLSARDDRGIRGNAPLVAVAVLVVAANIGLILVATDLVRRRAPQGIMPRRLPGAADAPTPRSG